MKERASREGEELMVRSDEEGGEEVPSRLGIHGLQVLAKAAIWSRLAIITLYGSTCVSGVNASKPAARCISEEFSGCLVMYLCACTLAS